ncbi:MAG TPA: hypothetical protein VLT33_01290 [Labilithrix sp.]|nr:hypothetical protein [Labilithrix sp.]
MSGTSLARALAILALALLLGTACVKRDTAVENRPLADNLAAYWTCAVAFTSDGRGEDANDAFTFVPWFEGRVRERGVFEPLGRDEGAESEVTLRLEATTSDQRVTLRMLLVDTKTKEPLGDVEALASLESGADAGDATESTRMVALHGAADRILDVLKEKRRTSSSKARHAPPPVAEIDPGPVGGSAVCTTQCHPPAAAVSSHDEQYRVSSGMNGTMKELRGCLDRVGAQLVEPAVLLRFSPDGQLRHMRVDVGGYEQNECILAVRARLPRGVRAARASLLRCEYRCTTS